MGGQSARGRWRWSQAGLWGGLGAMCAAQAGWAVAGLAAASPPGLVPLTQHGLPVTPAWQPMQVLVHAYRLAGAGYRWRDPARLLQAAALCDQVAAVPWSREPQSFTLSGKGPERAAVLPAASPPLSLEPSILRRDADQLQGGDGRIRRYARKAGVRRQAGHAVRYSMQVLEEGYGHAWWWGFVGLSRAHLALACDPRSTLELRVRDTSGRVLARARSREGIAPLELVPPSASRVKIEVVHPVGAPAGYCLIID